MNCPQCGASNEARDSFCNACGYNFSSQMKIVRMDQATNQPRPARRMSQKSANNRFLAIWFSVTIIIFLVIVLLFKA